MSTVEQSDPHSENVPTLPDEHLHRGDKVSISKLNWRKSVAKKYLGKFFPKSGRVQTLNLLNELYKWGKEHQVQCFGEKKLDIDEHVHNEVIKGGEVTYLEFGVHRGNSIKFWGKINDHPDSRFYGFDSFEGFPIEWDKFFGSMEKEHFDVGGNTPLTDDQRIHFVKGWFQHTLDGFLEDFEPRGQLIVNVDSDLYESALYILTRMNQWLKPGVIVFFDDFSSVQNDFSALHDYCRAYMKKYEVIGSGGPYYNRVALTITE